MPPSRELVLDSFKHPWKKTKLLEFRIFSRHSDKRTTRLRTRPIYVRTYPQRAQQNGQPVRPSVQLEIVLQARASCMVLS